MKTRRFTLRAGRPVFSLCTVVAVAAALMPATADAQTRKKNPVSKIYVADVSGEALIDTGELVEDLSKRTVYTAQGTVIETKKPENDKDRAKYYSTMVYSNGTGAFFDADTRVEVRRFVQEPFTPNRTDVEMEPSISQTQAFIARGTVGLCTSKLVAGSTMTYQTPLGSVNIRGRKVVIEALPDVTKISMIEGDSTVRAGGNEMAGHIVRSGEQAIIRRGAPGQPATIEIQRIPQDELPQLDERVSMACMAKRTVYFEVRERAEGAGGALLNPFDGNSSGVNREIVPVPVVPINLPVEFTISPARLTTPGNGPPAN